MTPAGGRRLLHAATAAILVVIPLAGWSLLRPAVLGAAAGMILLETARLGVPRFGAWLARALPVYRAPEARRPSGAAWLWLGYAAAVWLPAPAAAAGILAAALADPAAAAVGERWGRGPGKTWAGTAAALAAAAAALVALGLPPRAAGAGALAAAALERWPGPFDDNLLLAPGVAAVVALAA